MTEFSIVGRSGRAPMRQPRQVLREERLYTESVRLQGLHRSRNVVCMSTHRKPGPVPTPWQIRFWKHVTPAGGSCWEWRGMRHQQGYGRLATVGRGTIFAHRASYILHHGAIPDGIDVLHECDNPPCVNPAHLFLGTHTDNMRDMARKGRAGARSGSANHWTRVPWETVCEIRRLSGDGARNSVLAQQFGVTPTYVGLVVKGRVRKAA